MPDPVRVTTTAKVQEILQLATLVQAQTSLIESLIAGVGAAFEREMDRYLEQAARTETFDVRDDQSRWSLRGFPVTAIASVKFDQTAQWTGDEVTHSARLYRLALNDAEEHLLYVESPSAVGPKVMRVTYTGGLATSTAALISAFPDLAKAAALEVSNLYQRRSSLSIQAMGTVGADNQLFLSLAMLPLTREVVGRLKRW